MAFFLCACAGAQEETEGGNEKKEGRERERRSVGFEARRGKKETNSREQMNDI